MAHRIFMIRKKREKEKHRHQRLSMSITNNNNILRHCHEWETGINFGDHRVIAGPSLCRLGGIGSISWEREGTNYHQRQINHSSNTQHENQHSLGKHLGKQQEQKVRALEKTGTEDHSTSPNLGRDEEGIKEVLKAAQALHAAARNQSGYDLQRMPSLDVRSVHKQGSEVAGKGAGTRMENTFQQVNNSC